MDQVFCEVENTDPEQHKKWLEKHGFQPGEDGSFRVDSFEGKTPVGVDTLLSNIRTNVCASGYSSLYAGVYDERTFVMVCGGPSLGDHLDEIREKCLNPDKYLVVCSNMTGGYLLQHGIVPHVHFILDPQEKKKYDVRPGNTNPAIQYWINVACHPAVFAELREQGIKPYAFLADFESDGKAADAVKESMIPGQPGMMAIQGGTMAGLRALNLADALGHRTMEYYGFDAIVRVENGMAQPYAYEKKRGEAIIEISCDRCDAKFDTTLIFQRQVNEFIKWRSMMPWLDVTIIGGGLIDHYVKHVEDIERATVHVPYRFTSHYAEIQKTLHREQDYGTTGSMYMPTIFHGISQLAKRLGAVSVLDYGSAAGNTMKSVRQHFWMPPIVSDRCYDPFVEEFSAEPEAADMVICTDVMEHIEPQCTKAVMDHLAALTKRIIFFSIALCPANKILADGRNAHINIRTAEYWLREIKKRFITSEAKVSGDGNDLLVVAQAIDDVREIMRNRKDEQRIAA